MNYNKNAGYGQVIGQFPFIGSGKVFIVGDSGTANRDMLVDIFDTDIDGKARYFATLDQAIGECTSNAGDVIYVMPGHTETVTSTSIALDVAGITIINLGNGKNAPTYTFSTAAATITASAANIKWVGGFFIGNYLDVASAFTLGAAKDFVLENAIFQDSTSILNFLSIVTTGATANAADGLTVKGCKFYGLNTTPLAFISVLGTLDRLEVVGNYVNSASTADVGHFITFADKNATNVKISHNDLIVVGATDATVGIFLTGSGTAFTGIVDNNYVASLDTTTELIATAGTKLKFIENYYTGTADASGKLFPAVDGA